MTRFVLHLDSEVGLQEEVEGLVAEALPLWEEVCEEGGEAGGALHGGGEPEEGPGGQAGRTAAGTQLLGQQVQQGLWRSIVDSFRYRHYDLSLFYITLRHWSDILTTD